MDVAEDLNSNEMSSSWISLAPSGVAAPVKQSST